MMQSHGFGCNMLQTISDCPHHQRHWICCTHLLTRLSDTVAASCRGSDDVLYYSVRSTPSGGPRAPPLTGPKIESDLPTQAWDDRLLGQIDSVEAGIVSGWACLKGQQSPSPLEVVLSLFPTRASLCTCCCNHVTLSLLMYALQTCLALPELLPCLSC